MATLQERRLGYHSQAGLEPGTSRFSTLRLNHYAARGIFSGCARAPAYQCLCARASDARLHARARLSAARPTGMYQLGHSGATALSRHFARVASSGSSIAVVERVSARLAGARGPAPRRPVGAVGAPAPPTDRTTPASSRPPWKSKTRSPLRPPCSATSPP